MALMTNPTQKKGDSNYQKGGYGDGYAVYGIAAGLIHGEKDENRHAKADNHMSQNFTFPVVKYAGVTESYAQENRYQDLQYFYLGFHVFV
jgi:hypothetical protein